MAQLQPDWFGYSLFQAIRGNFEEGVAAQVIEDLKLPLQSFGFKIVCLQITKKRTAKDFSYKRNANGEFPATEEDKDYREILELQSLMVENRDLRIRELDLAHTPDQTAQ